MISYEMRRVQFLPDRTSNNYLANDKSFLTSWYIKRSQDCLCSFSKWKILPGRKQEPQNKSVEMQHCRSGSNCRIQRLSCLFYGSGGVMKSKNYLMYPNCFFCGSRVIVVTENDLLKHYIASVTHRNPYVLNPWARMPGIPAT